MFLSLYSESRDFKKERCHLENYMNGLFEESDAHFLKKGQFGYLLYCETSECSVIVTGSCLAPASRNCPSSIHFSHKSKSAFPYFGDWVLSGTWNPLAPTPGVLESQAHATSSSFQNAFLPVCVCPQVCISSDARHLARFLISFALNLSTGVGWLTG